MSQPYQQAIFNFGPLEIVAIAAVVLLIFGPKRLPELAKGMGKGIRDFKKALGGVGDDIKDISPSEDEKEESSEAETPAEEKPKK